MQKLSCELNINIDIISQTIVIIHKEIIKFSYPFRGIINSKILHQTVILHHHIKATIQSLGNPSYSRPFK